MIAVNNDTWMLILLLAVVFGALVATTTFSGRGSPVSYTHLTLPTIA